VIILPEWIAKYWLEWVFGLLIAILTFVVRTLSTRIRKQQEENQALRDGMRSLLKRNILCDCETAFENGFCDIDRKATIDDMYNAYHALGGNGAISRLHAQLMNLPTFKAEVKTHD